LRITVDTNLLVRLFVGDDSAQMSVALAEMASAEAVAVTLPTLCEFAWVMGSGYKVGRTRLMAYVTELIDSASVVSDRAAVDAGLGALAAGADFADGVIAHEGAALGGEVFVSFDRRAVRALQSRGLQARAPRTGPSSPSAEPG
jgi:predicted nucleic-acid-binding protein